MQTRRRGGLRFSVLLSLLLSSGIAGCGENGPETTPDAYPDAPDPGVTITIAFVDAPTLVAFRDGVEGAWQPATMKTPTRFEAKVHGPYVVAAMCEQPISGDFSTWRAARTPDDEHEVTLDCVRPAQSRHTVSGHMVQAGRVQIYNGITTSPAADWDFNFSVLSGTLDLIAVTADRIALRRGIVVAGNVEVTPPIDVLQEGASLASVAFTVPNAEPAEVLITEVYLPTLSPAYPLYIYTGPIATAKVASDAALVASDVQSVRISATAGNGDRTLARPFRVGGNTAFTFPAPLGNVQWDHANGDIAVTWSSVPEFDTLLVHVIGVSPDSVTNHGLELSRRFLAATGLTQMALDTDIPGYKLEWRIDFAGQYYRRLQATRETSGERTTSSVTESINVEAATVLPAAMAPRRAFARLTPSVL